MKVVLIRHLKTPGNELRQYIGNTDENLSARAVEHFQSQKTPYPTVQRIVASPMKRCIQTARLIYPNQEIETEEMLRECNFGRFEGKTYEQLKEEPAYIRWLESGGRIAFPGGEDQETFRRRCVAGVQKWVLNLLEEGIQSTAFVVHGGTIMAALSRLGEDPGDFYRWQVENGAGYEAEAVMEEWKAGRTVLREIRQIG